MGENGPKRAKMAQNVPKWPKMGQNGHFGVLLRGLDLRLYLELESRNTPFPLSYFWTISMSLGLVPDDPERA